VMMKFHFPFSCFLFLLLALSCGSGEQFPVYATDPGQQKILTDSFNHIGIYPWLNTYDKKNCLNLRFDPPSGYKRLGHEKGSFAEWLSHLPLKTGKPDVMLYNGEKKGNQDAHAAVIDMDVGQYDLQQCADAVMRLRAEYLYSKNKFDKISFNYTSGDAVPFSKWMEGKRTVISGNKVTWKSGAAKGSGRDVFASYLKSIFTYAGSLSLSRELEPIEFNELHTGDVFILGGSPGHAVIVLDISVNNMGQHMFMLAQSYMPAQEMHVLKNPNDDNISPWYSVEETKGFLQTPEWRFRTDQLMRFGSDL